VAGYSSTPLVEKLGLKSGVRAYFLHTPSHYKDLLGPLPPDLRVLDRAQPPVDFIHAFFKDRRALEEQMPILAKMLSMTGMVWISWPKGTSGVPTDVGEGLVRAVGLKNGLVDVKVCAVDETWSGLKFVIPVKDRKKP
jgi:hypothetical protein